MQHDYKDRSLQMPYIFAVLYDPQVNLSTALHCGLVAFTEMPAMGLHTFTFTAETLIDELSIVKPPEDDSDCEIFYKKTLSLQNPPYTFYSYHLASLPIADLRPCDTNASTDAWCTSQVLLQYGSYVVSGMETKHKMEKIDILILEGAIVGAIQFFMWFLGIFTA